MRGPRPLAAACILLAGAVLHACGVQTHTADTDPAADATRSPDSAVRVAADWDDLEAAILAGGECVEAVIAETIDVSPDHKRFILRLDSGEPGQVDAQRSAVGAPAPELDLSARIGLSRDPERERRLLRAVVRRLEQIRGDRAAPIK